MIRTVVELDLVSYSTIADALEKGLNVQTVRQLNAQIQAFIDRGLNAVGRSRGANVMLETGDGAILVFARPADAHRFAEVVQAATREHNKASAEPLVKRLFRIGAATGEIVMEPKAGGGFDIAGMTIARAVRFETKARPGEIVVDISTLEGLTPDQRQRYGPRETITGKRAERFEAHRCQLNPDAVQDASFFGSRDQPAEQESEAAFAAFRGVSRDERREIIRLFDRLKPHQYVPLIFLLNIPINRRPQHWPDLAHCRNHILQWAEEESHGLESLHQELRGLVAPETDSHP